MAMLYSPPTSDSAGHVDEDDGGHYQSFDASRPFRGLVLCCTSIEADQRTEIAQRTADMGGTHKYDLTPDVTHLIVGDYNTAKYRHVAKERPDIKPMAAGWVHAVRKLWVEDREIDFAALEDSWTLKTFEVGGSDPALDPSDCERPKLICCLTGFEDNNVRAMIEDKVKVNGGEYVADLSRRVTHLIVSKPEGKKYNAARRWDIRCVTIEWLHDSVERGMILDETCYDPTLPPEEIGVGAWTRKDFRRISLGKRGREGSDASIQAGRRKLRKSASMRMNTQNTNLWGDILNQSAGDLSRPEDAQRKSSTPTAPSVTINTATLVAETTQQTIIKPAIQSSDSTWPALRKGVFSGCRFFIHGFPEPRERILLDFLTSHGGQISLSLDDVASSFHAEPPSQRYLLVPQLSHPNGHPKLPDGIHIITEFFIERCIHNKKLFHPSDHVWGQPFPRFPIDGFQQLTICTAGFVNEQLNQIEKTITQLGAKYSEKLNRQISLLICPDLGALREQKRDLAILHRIPIVNVEWLWQCITTGCLVPWDEFQFEELLRNINSIRARLEQKESKKKGKDTLHRTRSEPLVTKPTVARPNPRVQAPPSRAGIDTTAFDNGTAGVERPTPSLQKQETHESHYETAPTHQPHPDDAFTTTPLSETRASNLNKSSTSPPKPPKEDRPRPRFSTDGEVGDSEAGEDSDATTQGTAKHLQLADASETERLRGVRQVENPERLELAKKLNSLMASNDGAQEGTALLPRPAQRKRQILGRATSNVSAASSASADSAAHTTTRQQQQQQLETTRSASGGGSEFDRFLEEPAGENAEVDVYSVPSSTQLQYDNPEARKKRNFVMERMKIMGDGEGGSKGKGKGKSANDFEGGAEGGSESRNRQPSLSSVQSIAREIDPVRRSTRRSGR